MSMGKLFRKSQGLISSAQFMDKVSVSFEAEKVSISSLGNGNCAIHFYMRNFLSQANDSVKRSACRRQPVVFNVKISFSGTWHDRNVWEKVWVKIRKKKFFCELQEVCATHKQIFLHKDAHWCSCATHTYMVRCTLYLTRVSKGTLDIVCDAQSQRAPHKRSGQLKTGHLPFFSI